MARDYPPFIWREYHQDVAILETGNNAMTAPVRMGQPGSTPLGHNRFGLTGVSKSFDTRLIAIRADLADIAVAGEHFAPHYAAPMMGSGVAPYAAMRDAPDLSAPMVSELLYGEAFALLDVTGGWAWGYSHTDHRVGYVAVDALGPTIAPTHMVVRDDVLVHSKMDSNSGGSAILPFGALLMGDVQGEWLAVSAGFVPLSSVTPVGTPADMASTAAHFLDAPYLSGGRTAKGIDAAALVQISAQAAGLSLPRDADTQQMAATITVDAPQRGDLMFIGDHVGLMIDADHVLHACPIQGKVVSEPLSMAVSRRSGSIDTADPTPIFKRLP